MQSGAGYVGTGMLEQYVFTVLHQSPRRQKAPECSKIGSEWRVDLLSSGSSVLHKTVFIWSKVGPNL